MRRFLYWLLCREYLNTFIYGVLPAVILIIFVRFPSVDLVSFDGWQALLDGRTLISMAVMTVVLVWSLSRVITFFVMMRRSRAFREGSDAHVLVHVGAPGTGKTVTAKELAYWTARDHWRRLQFDYIAERANYDRYKADLSSADPRIVQIARDKLAHYEYLRKSYLTMRQREKDCIPLLYSTIPICVNGRYSYELTADMISQKELLPAYAVCFNDEVGVDLGSDVSRTLPAEVAQFFRFPRHFGDYTYIATEQDSAGANIYLRRCADNNRYCIDQKWIMRPTILIWIVDFLRRRILRVNDSLNPEFAPGSKAETDYFCGKAKVEKDMKLVLFLDRLAHTIGFRRIRYYDEGNIQRTINPFKGRGVMVVPSYSAVKYDDHAFEFLNHALWADVGKTVVAPIAAKSWQAMRIDRHSDALDARYRDK